MIRVRVAGVLFAICLFFFSTTRVHAESNILWSDDFSGLNTWEVIWNAQTDTPNEPCRGADDDPVWSFVEGVAFLHIAESAPCKSVIAPTNTDISWPTVSEVQFAMRITNPEMDRNLLFRWQDAGTYLGFHIYDSHIVAEKFIDGQSYPLPPQGGYFDFRLNHTYQIRMRHDRSTGKFQLWIDTTLVFTGYERPSDPSYNFGTIALGGSVGEKPSSVVWFDQVSVWDVSETTTLPVPAYSQIYERWRNDIYDQASSWTTGNTSIGRWGCALTSAVMVLRFHGIQQLPNGEVLHPNSLNEWLITQSDGYVYPGLVNWRALSRLTAWHRDTYGTPALEMQYASSSSPLTWIDEQIAAGKAPILDQQGHFVVAHTSGPGEDDVGIHDPLYEYTHLSAYENSFHSARVFTPSFTDLSALSIYTSPGTQLHVTAGDEELSLKPLEIFSIADPDGEQTSKTYWLYDIAKPDENMELTLSSSSPLDTIQWVAYKKSGEIAAVSAQHTRPITATTLSFTIRQTENGPAFKAPPPATAPRPLQRADLAAWLSWRDIRSPLVTEEIWTVFTELQASTDQEAAEGLVNTWELRSQNLMENGWLTHAIKTHIDDYFYRVILEKFP